MDKRRILEAIVLSSVLSVGTVSTQAESLALFDTGVNSSGLTLPDGATDPHYAVISSPGGGGGGPAFVAITNIPSSYIAADAVGVTGSEWISGPLINQGSTAQGDFDYRATFTVPAAFNPSTWSATITGRIAADNTVTIDLNGKVVQDITQDPAFTKYTQLSILDPTAFQAGSNTLDFIVHNTAPSPQALRIDGIKGDVSAPGIGGPGPGVVPEPASLISSLTGIVVVAGMMAKRRWLAVKA